MLNRRQPESQNKSEKRKSMQISALKWVPVSRSARPCSTTVLQVRSSQSRNVFLLLLVQLLRTSMPTMIQLVTWLLPERERERECVCVKIGFSASQIGQICTHDLACCFSADICLEASVSIVCAQTQVANCPPFSQSLNREAKNPSQMNNSVKSFCSSISREQQRENNTCMGMSYRNRQQFLFR